MRLFAARRTIAAQAAAAMRGVVPDDELASRLSAHFSSELTEDEEVDRVIVAFSGGKDSRACVLRLFELGVPASLIEL